MVSPLKSRKKVETLATRTAIPDVVMEEMRFVGNDITSYDGKSMQPSGTISNPFKPKL
jgi:hypothetical protein